MCGICGEIRFDNVGVNRETSKRMIDTISRRGPDNEGLFFHNQLFLGHRRLSVIDVTEKSHQPMTDHSLNLTIVFNTLAFRLLLNKYPRPLTERTPVILFFTKIFAIE